MSLMCGWRARGCGCCCRRRNELLPSCGEQIPCLVCCRGTGGVACWPQFSHPSPLAAVAEVATAQTQPAAAFAFGPPNRCAVDGCSSSLVGVANGAVVVVALSRPHSCRHYCLHHCCLHHCTCTRCYYYHLHHYLSLLTGRLVAASVAPAAETCAVA